MSSGITIVTRSITIDGIRFNRIISMIGAT